MEIKFIILPIVAVLTSLLTFFSGFGVGTILTPVFIIFFPVELAVALTAVVHFLNNIFKFFLIGRNVDKGVLLRFGITAVIGAFIGAFILIRLTRGVTLFSYDLFGFHYQVTFLKLVIGVLMISFAMFELVPKLKEIEFGKSRLPLGGFLSGFFGGLSGNQGALRSAFLIKTGISKEAFIATGVAISLFVDITRISTYFSEFFRDELQKNWMLLTITILAAFLGAFIGRQLLKKVTINLVQNIVGIMIMAIGVLLIAGII